MFSVERGVVGWLACMSIKLLVGEGHVCKSSLMQERNQTTKQQYIAPHTLLCVYVPRCVCVQCLLYNGCIVHWTSCEEDFSCHSLLTSFPDHVSLQQLDTINAFVDTAVTENLENFCYLEFSCDLTMQLVVQQLISYFSLLHHFQSIHVYISNKPYISIFCNTA